jgi:rod shape-determining protein MreC
MAVSRRDSRPRSILVIAIFTSLVLITVDSRGSGILERVRSATRDVLAPVESVADDAFSPVRDLFGGVANYGSVKDQNAQLRRDVADLKGKLDRERAVGSQVGELEKLLDLPTIEDADGVAARVIGGSPGNFERTVQINKGSGSGLAVGQPVVSGDALVGKVTAVSATLATVTLLDDPGLGIGVRLENSNVRGVAEGRTGERDMRLNFLEKNLPECSKDQSPDTCIKKGELVFTSATQDNAFPPDIAVAKVVGIEKLKGELEKTITIEPAANLDDLTYVKVLLSSESKKTK